MKFFENFAFIIKYALIGTLVGFAVLFFIPNSPMSFNWGEAKQAWSFYKQSQNNQSNEQTPVNLAKSSFADAVDKAGPSVVSVRSIRKSRVRPATNGREGDVFVDTPFGVGSGVIFDENGYIVTNYHVVDKSARIAVQFSNGVRKYADIVGIDQKNDIAVLKVNIKTPNVAELGVSSDVRAGDVVMAIGTPFGVFDNSVTKGIISSIDHGPISPLIQTDAAINYGNSGGALVNSEGKVIGISSAKFSLEKNGNDNTGINFGIPIDTVKEVFDQLITHGRVVRNWFGANVKNFSPEFYRQLGLEVENISGLLVTQVEAGSPSAEAGLMRGDYLVEFDGHNVPSSMEGLRKIFVQIPIGKEISIEVIRKKQRVRMQLKLKEKPQS